MRKSTWFVWRLVICWLGLSVLCPVASLGADRKETIRQARDAYYSLKHEGLEEFRCQVAVDWDSVFKKLKTDAPSQDEVLPILRKTRFQLLVGHEGSSTVSHQSELASPNEQVAERVRKATAGVEQMLTGFMQTWAVFMVRPPLPSVDSDYRLEDLGKNYRLSYNDGQADVVTLMAQDFSISEMNIKMPELEGSLHPKLSREKGGFVVSSWDATNKPAAGALQQMEVKVEYQSVEGLELPHKVDIAVSSPVTLAVSLTFDDYHVKRIDPTVTPGS